MIEHGWVKIERNKQRICARRAEAFNQFSKVLFMPSRGRAHRAHSPPLPPGASRPTSTSPTPRAGYYQDLPGPTSMDLVVINDSSKMVSRMHLPAPGSVPSKIARKAWGQPRGGMSGAASEQPVYQGFLPSAPTTPRPISAQRPALNNALANRVDAVAQRVDALRPHSAPPRKVPGAGGEGPAKQLQYELAMTTKVFSSAQDQLEVERRRTRDAKAREERALVAAEVVRLEAAVSVTEADSKREAIERQLAQLLNEQRAKLESELQEAQKLNEEQLAAERTEREELAERTAELEEQIAEVESLRRERDEARAETQHFIDAAGEKHVEELERLRKELTGTVEEQAAARAESERLKRIEQMAKKAGARISNQGLMRGWSGWQEQWLNHCRQKRMLAAAGARIARPALAAAVAHWRADWQFVEKRHAAAAANSTAQLLEEATSTSKRLEARIARLEEKHAATLATTLKAAADQKTAALERLRKELTGSVEQQAAARAEAEKERRIEQLHKKAAARIGNQGLMRGWSGWHGQWEAAARQKRMLAAAGARLAKPGLAAAIAHWRKDWQAEAMAGTVQGARQKLAQEQAKNAELAENLRSERAEYHLAG